MLHKSKYDWFWDPPPFWMNKTEDQVLWKTMIYSKSVVEQFNVRKFGINSYVYYRHVHNFKEYFCLNVNNFGINLYIMYLTRIQYENLVFWMLEVSLIYKYAHNPTYYACISVFILNNTLYFVYYIICFLPLNAVKLVKEVQVYKNLWIAYIPIFFQSPIFPQKTSFPHCGFQTAGNSTSLNKSDTFQSTRENNLHAFHSLTPTHG